MMTRSLALIAVLSLAAACNQSEEGAEGNLLFTPQNCGWLAGCDFDASLAVFGTAEVHIDPARSDVSTAGLDLVSRDPGVLEVTAIPDVGGQPTWELYGVGEGVTTLEAIDADGAVVDFLEVPVQHLDGLRLQDFVGEAVGPTSDQDFDEIWTVNADQNVSFQVIPTIGPDDIMGDMQYTVTLHTVGFEQYMVEGAEISDGYFYFNAPAGQYEVEVVADNGVDFWVLFDVQ